VSIIFIETNDIINDLLETLEGTFQQKYAGERYTYEINSLVDVEYSVKKFKEICDVISVNKIANVNVEVYARTKINVEKLESYVKDEDKNDDSWVEDFACLGWVRD
jgi:restriction endonuclease S subunit